MSGQKGKIVNGDQRYGYMPCPLHDTGEKTLIFSFIFAFKKKYGWNIFILGM